MSIFRSETMRHGTLVLPAERAKFFVNLLGHRGGLQFEDMNARSLRRNYRKYVQRIEELERIIRFLSDELQNRGKVPVVSGTDEFLEVCDTCYRLENVEDQLTKTYQQFIKFRDNNLTLSNEFNAALEEKFVCRVACSQRGNFAELPQRSLASIEDGRMIDSAGFSNLAGVISTADKEKFARTIFRATRGNTFCDFQEIEEPVRDPKTGTETKKSVFVAFYQGGGASAMYQKVLKIAQAFGASIYNWPRDQRTAVDRLRILEELLIDKQHAVSAYDRFLEGEVSLLIGVPRPGGSSLIEEWRMLCAKEKAVYAVLNMFEGEQTLRADCWFPAVQEDNIRRLLLEQAQPGHVSAMLLTDQAGEHGSVPPTYIRTNDFTRPFQDLVDTYGIPKYKEINPAIFATVTFPFLFGVMFGDVGHGTLLTIIGLWAVAQGPKIRKSIPQLFYARYLVLAMGISAVYAGFMYSEFFSIGLNLFGSSFKCSETDAQCLMDDSYGAYPFGLDPGWIGASNMLLFVNSLKMKLAVLFGVTQMLLGVFLKFGNAIHFRSNLDLFCECIPQLIFLSSVFGYMDFMITYKWTHVNANTPSLISAMINMGLMQPMKDKQILFNGQESVQQTLVNLAMISVPWMLLPKPLILWSRHYFSSRRFIGRQRALSEDGGQALVSGHSSGNHAEFDFGEIFIHQLIETIEFVLGSVSHTASYLRLWALSLAHQQLSIVFIGKILYPAMSGWWLFNAVSIYIQFAIFIVVTVGILLGVDTLECFLHTLRLHWVEFQSKFYKGEGIKFEPFFHSTSLDKNK